MVVTKLSNRAIRRTRARRCVLAASAVCLSLGLVVACSSSKSKGSQSSASPIVIGMESAVHTSLVTYGPGAVAGLQGYVRAVNKSGGINGHPVKVFVCDTQEQPNLEISCARQAVAQHVVAMVGSNIVYQGAQYEKILSAAHIADVENSGPLPTNYGGSNTFPITWETGSFMPCVNQLIAKAAHGTKVVAVQNLVTQVAQFFNPLMANTTKASGVKWLPPITAPANVSDFSPYVAQAQKSGADIVVSMLVGSGPQAFVRASSAAGTKYAICTALGLSGSGGWAGTGSAGDNLYVGATFPPLSSDLPLMKQFNADMVAEKASGDNGADTSPAKFTAQMMTSWLAGLTFKQVAESISGTIDAPAFLKAISTAKVTFGGILPDIDFAAKAETGGPYEHVYGSGAYLWKWNSASGTYSSAGQVQDTFKAAQG
jgi:ABC-type branched-subunit amino acid transport system substrate-binding protein